MNFFVKIYKICEQLANPSLATLPVLYERQATYSPSVYGLFWMSSVNFLSLCSEKGKKLGVKCLTNSTLDDLLYPNNGLYNQAPGPTELYELCLTCG